MEADDISSDAVISLRDGMGIRDAGHLMQELRAAIEAHGAVTVETSALASVDVTILQVLIAAHKTAGARGTGLRIRAARDGVLATALARSGIAASVDSPLIWDGEDWTGLGQPKGEGAA